MVALGPSFLYTSHIGLDKDIMADTEENSVFTGFTYHSE